MGRVDPRNLFLLASGNASAFPLYVFLLALICVTTLQLVFVFECAWIFWCMKSARAHFFKLLAIECFGKGVRVLFECSAKELWVLCECSCEWSSEGL